MSTGPDATEVTGPAPPPPCDPAARRTGIVLAVLLVVVSFTGVVFQSLWNGNDGNWAALIWASNHEGWPWAVGTPPPLLMLLAALCRATGRVTPGVLRSLSASCAFGVLLVVHRMVRVRSGPPAAGPGLAPWAATFTCATAVVFARHARLVDSELPLAFAVTLTLFLFWWAWTRTEGPQLRFFIPFVVALTACSINGLGAPALVVLGVGCFLARERRWVPLAVLAGAGCAALVVGGRVSRFIDAGVSYRAMWERAPLALCSLPGGLLPWTLPVALSLFAFVRPGTRFRQPLDRFVRSVLAGLLLGAAASAVVAGGGVPALLFVPWLAIACGVWIAERSSDPRPGFVARLAVNGTAFVTCFALLAVPVGFLYGQMAFPDTVRVAGRLGLSEMRAVVALMVTLASGWTYMRCRRRYRSTMWPLAPAGAAMLMVAAFGVAGPVIEYNRTLAPVVQLLRAEKIPFALAEQRAGDYGVLTLALGEKPTWIARTEDAAAWLAGPAPRALVAPSGRFPELEAQARAGAFALVPVDGGRHAREYVVYFKKPLPAR